MPLFHAMARLLAAFRSFESGGPFELGFPSIRQMVLCALWLTGLGYEPLLRV